MTISFYSHAIQLRVHIVYFVVSGDANFVMTATRLTIGGSWAMATKTPLSEHFFKLEEEGLSKTFVTGSEKTRHIFIFAKI